MKVYLCVPFSEKDEAKKLGAMWDNVHKKWYVKNSKNLTKFKKWMPGKGVSEWTEKNVWDDSSLKTYLNVPFEERSEVKRLGAKWDNMERKWYITPEKNKSKFWEWIY